VVSNPNQQKHFKLTHNKNSYSQFVYMYDDQQERFLIYETTAEYDKYYCLKFDEERPY
jgi:hypothetical protein